MSAKTRIALTVLVMIVSLVATSCGAETVRETVVVKETVEVVKEATAQVIEKEVTKEVVLTPTPLPPTATPSDTSITVVIPVEPPNLDAAFTSGAPQLCVSFQIQDPLVLADPSLQTLQPMLATSWEWEDNTTLRMHLREGVTFHDGTPFDADDVKFTFDRMRVPDFKGTQVRFFSEATFQDVVVEDPYTIIFKLTTPYTAFLRQLGLVGIASKESLERMGEEAYLGATVGTGPYRLLRWDRGSQIVLEAYDGYWQGPPAIDQVTFRFVSEASTRAAELLSGGADIIYPLSPADIERVDANATTRSISRPGLRSVWLRLNTTKAPLDNVQLRQALNYAVDREAIVEVLLAGNAVPLQAVIPPTVFGYPEDVPVAYPYDPDKAKELIAQSGFDTSTELRMMLVPGRLVNDKEVAEALVNYLADVGIKVSITQVDFETFLAALRQVDPQYDMIFGSNGNNTGDADYNLISNFTSTGSQGGYWNTPETDALIQEAHGETDPAKRLEMYEQVVLIMQEQAPALFLYVQNDLYGVSKRLNWEPRADETIYLFGASLNE